MDSIANTISMGLPGQILAAQVATQTSAQTAARQAAAAQTRAENEAAQNLAESFAETLAAASTDPSTATGKPAGALGAASLGETLSAGNIEQLGTEFESVFLSMLLKEMRNSLEDGLFGSEGSDSFGGMFDMFIGQHLAKTGSIGVGDLLVQQYSKGSPEETKVSDADQSTRVSFQA